MGMSLVVLMLTVATLVPALDPMYGTPLSSTCLAQHNYADRVVTLCDYFLMTSISL